MPVVQFVRADLGVRVTKSMRTPKRITDINAWFKTARKAIQELDDVMNQVEHGWYIFTHDVDIRWVKFDLRNRRDERAYVVIDRTVKFGSV